MLAGSSRAEIVGRRRRREEEEEVEFSSWCVEKRQGMGGNKHARIMSPGRNGVVIVLGSSMISPATVMPGDSGIERSSESFVCVTKFLELLLADAAAVNVMHNSSGGGDVMSNVVGLSREFPMSPMLTEEPVSLCGAITVKVCCKMRQRRIGTCGCLHASMCMCIVRGPSSGSWSRRSQRRNGALAVLHKLTRADSRR